MKNKLMITAAMAAVLGFAASVQASPIGLPPGTGITSIAGDTTSVDGGATLVTSLLNSPISGSDAGTLSSWVYSGDANNALGGYTFVYQVVLTSGQFDNLALNGFGDTSLVNVGYDSSSGTIAPVQVSRSSLTGNPIDFYFNPEITSGTTYLLIVNTSLTSYTTVNDVFQDGSQGNADALAPIPDGGMTVGLMGLALGACGLFARKLKRA